MPKGNLVPTDRLLDWHWDRAAGGESVAPARLDQELAMTIRQLHALDDALEPDPEFDDRLWEDLMETPAFAHPARRISVAPHPTAVGKWPGAPRPSHQRGRATSGWSTGAIATAAMVVLTLAAGYLAYRLAVPDQGGGSEATFAGVQGTSADHRLVGSWIVGTSGGAGGDSPLLVTFAGDGTMLASDAGGRPGHGAWKATGEDGAEFAYVTAETGVSGDVGALITVRGTARPDSGNNTWSGEYTLELSVPGQAAPFGGSPSTAIEASRIVVERAPSPPEPGEPGYAPATPTP